jgi:hypothetical protein
MTPPAAGPAGGDFHVMRHQVNVTETHVDHRRCALPAGYQFTAMYCVSGNSSMSSWPALAMTAPLAGLVTSKVPPSREARHAPLM